MVRISNGPKLTHAIVDARGPICLKWTKRSTNVDQKVYDGPYCCKMVPAVLEVDETMINAAEIVLCAPTVDEHIAMNLNCIESRQNEESNTNLFSFCTLFLFEISVSVCKSPIVY